MTGILLIGAVCGLLALLGIAFLAIGVIARRREDGKVARCTACTMGTVTRHMLKRLDDDLMPVPIVSYEVAGMDYEVAREFRGLSTGRNGFRTLANSNDEAFVSDSDWLHIRTGRHTDYNAISQRLWPLGSPMPVYYNPQDPSESFAQKVPSKPSLVGTVFTLVGAGIVVVSVLVFLIFINVL